MYNRKRRREIAKSLGLNKSETLSKSPHLTYNDLLSRSIEAGKQIHLSNKEAMLNEQIKVDAERDKKTIENLMKPIVDHRGKILKSGLTYEEALNVVESNKKLRNDL